MITKEDRPQTGKTLPVQQSAFPEDYKTKACALKTLAGFGRPEEPFRYFAVYEATLVSAQRLVRRNNSLCSVRT